MPRVIAETADLIAIDKPTGLIVHSDGRTDEPSLSEWLVERYPTQRGIGVPWVSPQGKVIDVAGIVHRLDRATSGVVLAARTPEIFAYLRAEFKARRVEKTYYAFAYGSVAGEKGRIVSEIARTNERPKRWYAKTCAESDPRAAVTDWRVAGRFDVRGESASFLELSPRTGRTHQLRVHLASIGHPIIADHLYASDRAKLLGFTRPALHARGIVISCNDLWQTFVSPWPSDFGAIQTDLYRLRPRSRALFLGHE